MALPVQLALVPSQLAVFHLVSEQFCKYVDRLRKGS